MHPTDHRAMIRHLRRLIKDNQPAYATTRNGRFRIVTVGSKWATPLSPHKRIPLTEITWSDNGTPKPAF